MATESKATKDLIEHRLSGSSRKSEETKRVTPQRSPTKEPKPLQYAGLSIATGHSTPQKAIPIASPRGVSIGSPSDKFFNAGSFSLSSELQFLSRSGSPTSPFSATSPSSKSKPRHRTSIVLNGVGDIDVNLPHISRRRLSSLVGISKGHHSDDEEEPYVPDSKEEQETISLLRRGVPRAPTQKTRKINRATLGTHKREPSDLISQLLAKERRKTAPPSGLSTPASPVHLPVAPSSDKKLSMRKLQLSP